MSYTHPIKRTITVDINGEESKVEALYEALHAMFGSPTCTWEMEYQLNTNNYLYTIIGEETGTETVYPGCYTLSNGDPGYPTEYEDDLALYADTVEEFISEFADSHNTEFDYYVDSEDKECDD